MNQYKQAWMEAVDILPHVRFSDNKPEQDNSSTMVSFVKGEIQDHMIDAAILTGLTYMATSHYGKLRIVGSVGLRLLPVVGAAVLIYSVYDYFS